jgi:ribosomal RNA-processing protein 1
MATKAPQTDELPSLKDLASSDARLRRLAFQQISTHISERSTPLTYAQCLQLWRGFFVALYMHDSKSMISVQNFTASLADQFTVFAGKDAENECEVRVSQLGMFSEAFWETMAREWSGIDVHRMNKILLLIRLVLRNIFMICVPSAEDGNERSSSIRNTDEQSLILERWPLSPRERKVPDGLRYHVLDIWVEELEKARCNANSELHDELKTIEQKLMEPVEKLAKDGLTKPVRMRAKDTLAAAKEMFDSGEAEET